MRAGLAPPADALIMFSMLALALIVIAVPTVEVAEPTFPQPLHDAVRASDTDLVFELLRTTPQPLLDPQGRTALHVAVEAHSSSLNTIFILRALLFAGFDIDAPDFQGRTPRAMFPADSKRSAEMGRLLVDLKQDEERQQRQQEYVTISVPNTIAHVSAFYPFGPNLENPETSPRLRAQRKVALVVEKGLYGAYWLHLVNGTKKPFVFGDVERLPIYREILREGIWTPVEGLTEVKAPRSALNKFRCGNGPQSPTQIPPRSALSWPIQRSEVGLSRYRYAELGLVSNTFEQEAR